MVLPTIVQRRLSDLFDPSLSVNPFKLEKNSEKLLVFREK